MSVDTLNRMPLTQHLLASGAFRAQSFRVLDIGARAGAESHWRLYNDQVELIGFEPDQEECARLNEEARTAAFRQSFYPVALYCDRGMHTLHLSRNGMASSLLDTNWDFVNRLPQSDPGQIVGTMSVATTELDSFVRANAIGCIDFLKIDAEGAELAILEGAQETLDQSVLGISIEMFFQPYHRDRPLFSDIDQFLRGRGFVLFDLPHVERWRRKVWSTDNTQTWYGGGQLMWAQALYLRDPVGKAKTGGGGGPSLNRLNVLKLASLMEIFGLEDVALELLTVAGDLGWLDQAEARVYSGLLRRSAQQSNGFLSTCKRVARHVVPSPVRRRMRKVLESLLRA